MELWSRLECKTPVVPALMGLTIWLTYLGKSVFPMHRM